jgi:hypothetical protein
VEVEHVLLHETGLAMLAQRGVSASTKGIVQGATAFLAAAARELAERHATQRTIEVTYHRAQLAGATGAPKKALDKL